ncbi:MAG: M23/M37 family peptidase [Parcubacteria group bacterium GW2011_GWA1_47_8]|nr:MAG: M23/M37 family peptidase [Parcubacteria group bacterium GW2011_GWA1_47_8]
MYTITEWYTAWKSGVHANYGVLMWPYNNDGTQRFDKFASSKSTDDGKRPILRLDFTPTIEMKMPLPGNLSWAVTTEVGGWDSIGDWYDSAHDGINYFSIDFSWRNKDINGAQVYPDPNGTAVNIPIVAAASGRVRIAGGGDTQGNPNGFYVVIDHDYDNNSNTGFSTWYLHLKSSPLVYAGQNVTQGDILGYMGTTGKDSSGNPTSNGVHLHFGVKYGNSGSSTIPELTKVVMDGWLLKSFQSERVNGVYNNRYYRSGNRVY